MKNKKQFYLIIILTILIFINRDNLISIYNNIVNYLGDKIYLTTNKNKILDDSSVNKINKIERIKLKQNVETPGPLEKKDNIPVSNNSDLNIKGIIIQTNKNRKEIAGLKPLKENYKLYLSAKEKVDDMFKYQYFEHISPSGIGVSDLAKNNSYQYIILGENLALGIFEDNKALVDAWMASPGHRANILNKNYNEIGVAVKKGVFNGKSKWIAVQHYGLSSDSCPIIDNILNEVISLDKVQIKLTEEDMTIRKAFIDNRAVYEDLTINEQIDKYNLLVSEYNKLINKLKNNIDKYNKEVKEFNTCVEFYTKDKNKDNTLNIKKGNSIKEG